MRTLGSRLDATEKEVSRRLVAQARMDWWALLEEAQQTGASPDLTRDEAFAIVCALCTDGRGGEQGGDHQQRETS